MKKNRAAGFVVVSTDLRKILVLGRDGVGDLPKGLIEEGETSLSAALRECYEEAGVQIREESIISTNPFDCNRIDIYTAIQDGSPIIRPNPKSGIVEHEWCNWLTWRDSLVSVAWFLRPAIHYSRALCSTIREG